MPRPTKHGLLPWLFVAVALIVLLPAAYMGLYLLRCERSEAMGKVYRQCHTEWEANMFRPAASVEGLLIGQKTMPLSWPVDEWDP